MKALFWLIALFALAVAATQFAELNTGYALLVVPPWRIELSLNLLVVLLLATVGVLYALLRMLVEITGLPERVRRYRLRQRAEEAQTLERSARLAFFEGRYQRAERLSSDALKLTENDEAFAVNALLAARAAHVVRDYERRDVLFAELQQRLGSEHLATAMTMAELYLDKRRYADADAALARARAVSPKLTAALKLELRLRQREEKHDQVLRLIDQLQRSEALDEEQALRLKRQTHLLQLRQQQLTLPQLKDWWKKLPEGERQDPLLVADLAQAYAAQGAQHEARLVIEHALNAGDWSSELALVYGQLQLNDDEQIGQLQQAEAWLKQHPDDADLLLTLGRLCRRHSLWGKAQNYLEASLAVAPSAIAHAELAGLLEQLERDEAANKHYRASLDLALQRGALAN
ncbi:heme biosynthesis HemY N-terminal domain-containing protein [Chitinilyticum piscinae]|uniref:Heme biosynthesis protein HemY n=1 Tax=Chitinilyticum piscinae TaxID=2866724 RepID=A0A8J7K9L5_9NEIS|nr:heme biosynthesis HemY N-terminal domain-containing protein [Chitinilyticum piscinae]MBE9608344.1 heme biosynthesis protein HemY [Chitinilyticum piscinae]